MTSEAIPKMIREKSRVLSLRKRILFVVLVCCIQMLYLPTSFRTTGGIEPKLPIDIFPILPIWVVPYILCYPLWFFSVVWVILKMENRLFRAWLSSCSLTFSIANVLFVFFPTYVQKITFDGNDIFVSLLRILHEDGGRYSAFPSGHVYITTVLVLFFSRWYPRQRFLWLLILIVVSLSTLYTGQHYILDVLGGYAVAFTGYQFGLWWTGFLPSQKRPGKRIASSSLN